MAKLAIVILNWNRLADTKKVLRDLEGVAVDGVDLEIVVVDNGSKKDNVTELSKYKSKRFGYKFIRNAKNLGFAGGNNVGIKYAQSMAFDYIMILNNDVILDKNFLNPLFDVLKNEKVGAVSPKIYFAKGFEFHKDRYNKSEAGRVIWYAGGKIDWANVYGSTRGVDEVDIGQYERIVDTDYVTGTCFLVKSEVLKRVGNFDEKYYLYYEDTDLSQRIKRSDFSIKYVPTSSIWHKVSQSSGIGSGLNDYYTTRNRMLFGMKYAPMRSKLALIRESMRLLLTGRPWQRVGIRDFYLMRFGRGSFR